MEGETVVGLIGGGLGLLILLSLWGFELLSRWREHPERSRILHWMETRHLAGWLRRHH